MTNLSFLCHGGELFTRDHITAIHKHFPSVTKLSISPSEDTQMTRSVLDHYPRMKGLDLLDGFPGVAFVYMPPESTSDEIGITKLYVETDGVASSLWDFLAHESRQHQNTLEHITFITHQHIEKEEDEHGLQEVHSIEYRRLKQLDVCVLGWWIPRNAPMLEKLGISASTNPEEHGCP